MSPPTATDQGSRPAPPPPPPPEDPHSKISPFVLKLRSAPRGYFYEAPEPSPWVDLFDAPTGPYFLYGTLTDPSMIAEILGLDEEPTLRPAYIMGYRCKLWGQYPVYHVRSVEDGEKLAAYETNNYRASPCIIMYTDGKEPVKEYGSTFKFVGNKKDLSEGVFDLRVWLKMMGRHAAVEKLDAAKRIAVPE
ncbi:hypothetical protein BO94DRAFT_532280 [Aspergillus sclerotioniger CBS 115572]|uniref:Gamma-glutamylcyclotransferase AIG2-like domain-containing protein n=1 Tax=Aspergillus sclerotioniger CBS 115572 TaxID=1450535 RepID=A0A317X9N4_9EURO|nr:hypothetical protein BO94DRAFT_532280 [Aspergillus sclerotioniger CBS 115572]PWY94337.1 hypothetical protein BO94DRAFT_532280 [Aspergillus sclerotioniger CBS 115572]